MRIGLLHHDLPNRAAGSTEKLFRDLAYYFCNKSNIEIVLIYSRKSHQGTLSELQECNYKVITFDPVESEQHLGIFPSDKMNFEKSILKEKIDFIFTYVSTWGQKIVKMIPETVPVLLISPFGHYVSNGNVRKVLVSGASNCNFLKKIGVKSAEPFYNPLVVPSFNEVKYLRHKGAFSKIKFGRSGRPDDQIFDPISLYAFKRLRATYGSLVEYIYVNPPPRAIEMVERERISGVTFKGWLEPHELKSFYWEIDVFAHARKDGETLGVAIAEAMLFQNPVISHHSRHFNEHLSLLDGSCSCVAGIDDVESYYKCMKYYVTNSRLIPEQGTQARNIAATLFDHNIVFENIHEILLSINRGVLEREPFHLIISGIELYRKVRYFLVGMIRRRLK